MDNSPSVMVFPNSFADFQKETDDYYFPPLTGTYVRIIRNLVSILTVVMTPFILVLLNNPHWIPHWLDFINTTEDYSIPFFYQFLLLELVIDGLRLASLNTPNTLSGSLGIIGGLILSEFAVNAGWFVSETIIYMAFVAIASYAQPSFEMGYALKFSRIFILLLSQFFNFYGFFAGVVLVITVAACSKTLSGRGYLYPVIPFNFSDFKRLFVRTTLKNGKGH
jgi:stage V sporulation protein AF